MLDFSVATNDQILAVLYLFTDISYERADVLDSGLQRELTRIYVALENELTRRGLI